MNKVPMPLDDRQAMRLIAGVVVIVALVSAVLVGVGIAVAKLMGWC